MMLILKTGNVVSFNSVPYIVQGTELREITRRGITNEITLSLIPYDGVGEPIEMTFSPKVWAIDEKGLAPLLSLLTRS